MTISPTANDRDRFPIFGGTDPTAAWSFPALATRTRWACSALASDPASTLSASAARRGQGRQKGSVGDGRPVSSTENVVMSDLDDLRVFAIIAWIQLPTVMYGGYALLGLLSRGEPMTPFQLSNFRAGHAHAGVLTLLSLLYYVFLSQTTLSTTAKVVASIVLLVGIMLQSGGFFVHMARGQPGQRSIGTTLTTAGALLLAGASLFLAYALIFEW